MTKTALVRQHEHEARQAYAALLSLEKDARGMKRGAKGDSEGDADYRPLSWPTILLIIARGIIEEAEAIVHQRERDHAEDHTDEAPELSDEIEKDRNNLRRERERIEAIFSRRTF